MATKTRDDAELLGVEMSKKNADRLKAAVFHTFVWSSILVVPPSLPGVGSNDRSSVAKLSA